MDFERSGILALVKKTVSSGSSEAILESLRGWAWVDVIAPTQTRVPFNAISYNYCPTRRDLYLSYRKATRRETYATIAGRVFDKSVKLPIDSLKEILLSKDSGTIDPDEYADSVEAMVPNALKDRDRNSKYLVGNESQKLEEQAHKIIRSETFYWFCRLNYWLSHTPSLTREKLARTVIPLELDHPMEVEHMGYSGQLTPDFLIAGTNAIGELKTGERNFAHRVAVAGYALAYEALYHEPVDVGFVLYYNESKRKVPMYEVDVFGITNDLRRANVVHRNDGLKIVQLESPPPLAPEEVCEKCVYLYECRPERQTQNP